MTSVLDSLRRWFSAEAGASADDALPMPAFGEALRAAHAQPPRADEFARLHAVGGLVACVAFADGELSEAEVKVVNELLGRLPASCARDDVAVLEALRRYGKQLSQQGPHAFLAVLRREVSKADRSALLECLLLLAAADGQLDLAESHCLRRLADGLQLDQATYNALQAAHKAQLTVLRAD